MSHSEGALGCLRESLTVEENQGKSPSSLELVGFESRVQDGS
jgi:hypothetical protein